MRSRLIAYASQPHAEFVLFCAAFLEGMFLPVPVDLLLIPMVLLNVDRAFRYAMIATAGSVAGSVIGFMFGYVVYQAVGWHLLDSQTMGAVVRFSQMLFGDYTAILVLAAGFATLPFKIITFLSGFFGANLPQFVMAAVISRGARFFLVAWLLWRGGARYHQWLQRHFYGLTMVLTLVLLLMFAFIVFLWNSA